VKAIVISDRHALLPFAWRLRKEGVETKVVVFRDRFEKAWEGILPKALSGKEKNREGWDKLIEEAKEPDTLVLTDSRKAQAIFKDAKADAPMVLGSGPSTPFSDIPAIFLVGWFNGEEAQEPCYIIPDWGAYQGGMGRMVLGGAVLYNPEFQYGAYPLIPSEVFKEAGFRGIFLVGLKLNTVSKEMEPVGYTTGWPFLATHLYLSDQPNVGQLLTGEAKPTFAKRFTTGMLVSVPPWPVECNANSRLIRLEGLAEEDLGSIFFHDMQVLNDKEVWTAQLDGLIAVVRGAAQTPAYSRAKVLQIATRIRVPEVQYRMDVGGRVDSVLIGLEEVGLL